MWFGILLTVIIIICVVVTHKYRVDVGWICEKCGHGNTCKIKKKVKCVKCGEIVYI